MASLPLSAFKLLTTQQLLELHDKALVNLTSQTITVNLAFSGKNVGKQVIVNPVDLMDAVNRELRHRDPTTYGNIDTRTSATFS